MMTKIPSIHELNLSENMKIVHVCDGLSTGNDYDYIDYRNVNISYGENTEEPGAFYMYDYLKKEVRKMHSIEECKNVIDGMIEFQEKVKCFSKAGTY